MIDLGILKGVGDSSTSASSLCRRERRWKWIETSRRKARQQRRLAATSAQSLNLVEDEILRREKGERERAKTHPSVPSTTFSSSQPTFSPAPFFSLPEHFPPPSHPLSTGAR